MDDAIRATDHDGASLPSTLGAVLYAVDDELVPEKYWVRLVRQIAARDTEALRALVEASYRIVFTLAGRITANRDAAEEVTVSLYHDLWRHASRYDVNSETVIAWMMNRTRLRAFERLQLEMGASRAATRPTVAAAELDALSSDVLPLAQLWGRIEQRIGLKDAIGATPAGAWDEPEWKEVAPKISCKLLANDLKQHRVSMLVRLAPGGAYPSHRHAGLEELHLLEGELWIDGRKLVPGDYNRAQAGSVDKRVWSETGCACVLITSTRDDLAP